jgi:hypothetical protein
MTVLDGSRGDRAAAHNRQASPVKKRILITFAGGGFAGQTLRLIELLGEAYHFEYVVLKRLHQDVDSRIGQHRKRWMN